MLFRLLLPTSRRVRDTLSVVMALAQPVWVGQTCSPTLHAELARELALEGQSKAVSQ